MKKRFLIPLLFFPLFSFAQKPVATLRVVGDTLRFRFMGGDGMTERIQFSKMDSVDRYNAPQTNEGKICYWTFSSGNQQITVGHQNGKRPFSRVAVTDGKQTKYLDINFFETPIATFSPAYQQQFRGTATYEIPEVYELVNVAFALTRRGRTDPNMIGREGDYYARVMEHFQPFARHPLIVSLSERVQDNYNVYYRNRENAYAYAFKGTKIQNRGVYNALWSGSNDLSNNDQKNNPKLWEDFAQKSGFRKFYAANRAFYQRDIAEVTRLLPVKQMQTWLETKFPGIYYDGMRVVFSPLINGSHSAQKFESQGYRESLMFICDARGYDRKTYTEAQIEGLYSGVVFTEIDHNFVNPVSDRYLKEINTAFGDREKWVKRGDADNYGGTYAVFNEYMTHAVHLLYIQDLYPKDVFDLVRKRRVDMNAGPRGFHRFEAFADELLRRYETRKPGQTVADLYPALLTWAGDVKF